MTSTVSIITPAYNHQRWIGDCIASVQAQTYPHWEQIVIDDGSTDGTGDIVSSYLNDPRVRYVRQENKGIWRLVETYNRALAMSSGKFIAILEGDDLWPADKLESELPAFDDPSVGIVYGRDLVVDGEGKIVEDDILRRSEWEPPCASFAAPGPLPFLRDLLMLRGAVPAVTLMLRRSSLEDVGGFWQPAYFPAVDFSTLLKVATHHRASFLDRPLGYWRHHPGQTTDIHGLQYVLGHTRVAVEYFRSLAPEIQRALQVDERDIWDARRSYLANAYWRATRSAMSAGNWQQARDHATGMIRWGHVFRRVEGIGAWIASTLHVDINATIDWAADRRCGRVLVR